jgi:prefoldin subunit 4
MQDGDVQVTYEDQQKINQFARTNARLQDLKEELDSKKVFEFPVLIS